METKSGEKVKTLEKAILILDVVRESPCPLGVNEISRQCSVNITTAFRILKTLKRSGWVYQNRDEKYIIGPKISLATESNNFYTALKEVAYYTMTAMSSKTSQAMNLVVRNHNKCFILQQSRTEKIVDYVPPIGTVLPLYASATGKVLMSDLSEPLLGAILDSLVFKPFTKYTITTRTALLDELSHCREQGYALDAMESQENGFCIAVPIRCENEIVAALSFSGIIGKVQPDQITGYYQLLCTAAEEIVRNLSMMNGKELLRRCYLDNDDEDSDE